MSSSYYVYFGFQLFSFLYPFLIPRLTSQLTPLGAQKYSFCSSQTKYLFFWRPEAALNRLEIKEHLTRKLSSILAANQQPEMFLFKSFTNESNMVFF